MVTITSVPVPRTGGGTGLWGATGATGLWGATGATGPIGAAAIAK